MVYHHWTPAVVRSMPLDDLVWAHEALIDHLRALAESTE
jgi:hypothetical protein